MIIMAVVICTENVLLFNHLNTELNHICHFLALIGTMRGQILKMRKLSDIRERFLCMIFEHRHVKERANIFFT